jgi:hypothetical protein
MSWVAGLVASLVLFVAALEHVWHPGTLPGALRTHALVPTVLVAPIAVSVVAVEAAFGTVGLWATLADRGSELAIGAAVAVASMYALFALYSFVVFIRRPDAPCGCSSWGERISLATVIRAAILSAGATLSAAGPASLEPSAFELVVGIPAVVGLAVVLWTLPGALAVPPGVPALDEHGRRLA